MTAPDTRKLGHSDLLVTPIGIGVMQFAAGGGFFRFMFENTSQSEKDEIIRTALEGGVNWFDTAELYGAGRSERALAAALKNNEVRDADVVIADKWWPFPRFAGSISRTIDARLLSLAPYTIGLHQVHWPNSLSSIEAQMDEMAGLVEAGKIKAVGVSNFGADYTHQAHAALAKRGLGLASNQVQFSLIDRSIESNGILQAAKDLEVTIIAYSPLASGLLTGKYHKNPQTLSDTPFGRRIRLSGQIEETRALIEALDEIAQAHGVTIGQAALNWVIHFHGDVIVAIPGASKVSHARESAGVLDFRLTDEEMDKLDQLSRKYR
jgi:aryl-alcohol dehydrogenase-like predicted oxidoreductase